MKARLFLALSVGFLASCGDAPTAPLDPPLALSGECEGDIVPEGCTGGGGGSGATTSPPRPLRVSLYRNWSATEARFTIIHDRVGWDDGYVRIGSVGETVTLPYSSSSGTYAYARSRSVVESLCSFVDDSRVLTFRAYTNTGLSFRSVSGSAFLPGCENVGDPTPWN